jgi:hypothetical protein
MISAASKTCGQVLCPRVPGKDQTIGMGRVANLKNYWKIRLKIKTSFLISLNVLDVHANRAVIRIHRGGLGLDLPHIVSGNYCFTP